LVLERMLHLTGKYGYILHF